MSKKVLIVGGVAGGASVAARVRRLDESAEVIMFERGPNVSFSNCCLPYHLSGEIENSEDLVLMCPDKFASQYNIEARVYNEVTEIKKEEKKVVVKNLQSGEEYEESYDKLVLFPGAKPIMPRSIEGITNDNVFSVWNVVDIEKIKGYADDNKVKDVVVVGGGFIGVEIAENFKMNGRNVTLVEALDQIMSPFDKDMAQILHKEMYDNGIDLILEDGVSEIGEDHVVLQSGKKVGAGLVIMAIGVSPETSLAVDAGLELGETRGIKVDHSFLTNDPDIYAVGDAIEVYNKLTAKPCRLPLAGPAQRQARAAADHIYGKTHNNNGV